jgi:Lon protease-like protein
MQPEEGLSEKDLMALVAGASPRLKLFPLPESTLFPSQGVPLHVFEQRYRELVRDALRGDQVLGIPQIVPGQTREQHAHGPALLPILGVGVIAQHEALPDGRYNMVVRGVARARLLEELPPRHGYREARVELLQEESGELGEDFTAPLAACLVEIGRRVSAETAIALGQIAAVADPGRLADLSAAALLAPTYHQRVLAELNVARRLRFVTDHVAELLLPPKAEPGQLLN